MRISKPATAEEANAGGFDPWPAGQYGFTVKDASEEISAAGNEMIKLTLKVFNLDGKERTVFDYLLAAEEAQWKVRHFAEAVGLIEQYTAGDLDINEMVDRSGELKLRVKPAQGQYPAGNQVGDYIPMEDRPDRVGGAASKPEIAPPKTATRAMAPAGLDDEIPF